MADTIDSRHIEVLLQTGVNSYLMKDSILDDLSRIILAITSGKEVFSPEIIRFLRQAPPNNPNPNS
jgi:DNA-binding NarL/FixJ family response regulator